MYDTDFHIAVAERLMSYSFNDPDAVIARIEAGIHVTLAAVEEQRTTNLIAYLAICEKRGSKDSSYVALDKKVRELLGLDS